MSRLIYQIARPGCPWMEVPKVVYDDPPRFPWNKAEDIGRRVLIEATPEQIAEAENKNESQAT